MSTSDSKHYNFMSPVSVPRFRTVTWVSNFETSKSQQADSKQKITLNIICNNL